MQKIIPYLWFDGQAEEAAALYTSVFSNSAIESVTRYGGAGADASGNTEGSVMTVNFRAARLEFVALNGGPQFAFTPAVSFFVSCHTQQEVDQVWAALSDGGEILMPLDRYPFSDRFGWANDRFGVSWQVNLSKGPQTITPFLMFVGAQHGRAEEAIRLYTSLFDDSAISHIERFGSGEGETEGTVKQVAFTLARQAFMAMDSGLPHEFTFTEANSFLVNCNSQAEVDRLWEKLADGGEEQPCGWLKDRFGLSWQIIPTALFEMLSSPDRSEQVAQAMFQMKKLDIATLQRAYAGS